MSREWMTEAVAEEFAEGASVMARMAEGMAALIASAAERIVATYRVGGKLLLLGNGGSAAVAQHIAAELVGRFRIERTALSAIALTTDTSVLTAVANDYGYEDVFSRQLEALAAERDVLISISCSGSSPNVIRAVAMARSMGVFVIGLTGANSGALKDMANLAIVVPSSSTTRVQEAHVASGHAICSLVERALFEGSREQSSTDRVASPDGGSESSVYRG